MSIRRTLIILLLIIFSTTAFGQADIFIETQEKLDAISDEERVILEKLYAMEQEIREIQGKEVAVSDEIEGIRDEVKGLEASILKEEKSYDKNRDVLKEALKSYQRMGPASFLEILLDADSLGGFLKRLGAIRDLSRNTEELMASLDESRRQLEIQKAGLNEKLSSLEDQQAQLKDLLAEITRVKNEQEVYLASLEGKRQTYEDALGEINRAWDELKPIFTVATSEFTRLAEEGNLPPKAVQMTNVRFHVKATIKEEDFNKIILENVNLPLVKFEFYEGRIKLRIPELRLVLFGNFKVEEVNTLKFFVEEGSFYELPLEKASMDELFEKGDLLLKLETLIGKSKVETVKPEEGQLVLIVRPRI